MSNWTTTYQFVRGHMVIAKGRKFTWADNGRAAIYDRPCIKCGLKAVNDKAPDPCIGYLKGVKFACCGHGIEGQAYVAFADGRVIRDEKALEYFETVKKSGNNALAPENGNLTNNKK